MAKSTKKAEKSVENKQIVTRAEKRDATKNLIKEVLKTGAFKSNDLIDAAARLYTERFGGEETDNVNDVKGRVGSVLDVMKKEGEVSFDGGVYAMKTETPAPAEEKPAEKPAEKETVKTVKRSRKKEKTDESEEKAVKKRTTKKKESVSETQEESKAEVKTEEKPQAEKEEKTEEKALPKKRGRKPKAEKEKIAVTQEIKGIEPLSQEKNQTEEKNAETERAKTQEKIAESLENKGKEPLSEEKSEPRDFAPKTARNPAKNDVFNEGKNSVKNDTQNKAENPAKNDPPVEVKNPLPLFSPKGTLMDMSFLFNGVKPAKREEPKFVNRETKQESVSKTQTRSEEKPEVKEAKTETKQEEKPETKGEAKAEAKTQERAYSAPKTEKSAAKGEQPKKAEERTEQKREGRQDARRGQSQSGGRNAAKTLTADEKLQEAFLKKLRCLGGEYFEYYSVYLLEKYSRMNGRRLESLKISAGDRDGGIDGEIELTDALGFRETIYIQAKNWNPDKGDEKLWVVGETLLQQFIGACVCRQAKDGKQHSRGIFITTSRFTPEAKKILEDTSDKFLGYDGADLYETAKECGFGIVKKNGEWALDEQLLSGTKAFFNML